MRLFMICGLCIFMHCPSRYAVLLYNYIHVRKANVTLLSSLYVLLVLLAISRVVTLSITEVSFSHLCTIPWKLRQVDLLRMESKLRPKGALPCSW